MYLFFVFNDTATTEIYTLSLHDALPIYGPGNARRGSAKAGDGVWLDLNAEWGMRNVSGASPGERAFPEIPHSAFAIPQDRKSTRLNSSHLVISYAVFCLKKNK